MKIGKENKLHHYLPTFIETYHFTLLRIMYMR
jgi:hypothetical protein